MGEFWLNSPTHDKPNDMLDAISGAHIYGKNIIQAEGFTEVRGTWNEHPGILKALLDRNYALGINRLFFHVYVHNPWLDRKPGMTLDGIGLFFQRELGNQFGNVVFHQKVILLLSTSCGWGQGQVAVVRAVETCRIHRSAHAASGVCQNGHTPPYFVSLYTTLHAKR